MRVQAAEPAASEWRLPVTGAAPRRRLLLIALALGAFVGMVDATIVAVALDPISRHFSVTLAQSQGLLGVYLVTVTASVPTLGRLGDRLGRRRMYAAGFLVFAAGSVVAAVAPTFATLLLARVVQAVGGGLLTAGSLALIAEHAPRRSAGTSVAVLVVAQAVAGLAGPPLGGLLVALFGWQAVFWAGLPLGIAGVVLALRVVPRDSSARSVPVDLPGAVGVAALLLGVGAGIGSSGGSPLLGWAAPRWFAVAAGGALLLCVAEPRAARPIVDPGLLGDRTFGPAALATFLSTGTLMSCFALLPFWLEDAHGASAAVAGAAFLPIGAGIALTSRRAGILADRGGTRHLTAAGMTVAAAGLLLAAGGAALSVWALLAVGLFVLGCGNGFFSSPNTAAAIAVAPRAALGSASGLLSTARNAGVVVGLGVTGAVYTGAVHGGAHAPDGVAAAVFTGAAAICLAVGLLSHRVHRPAERPWPDRR